MTKYISDIVEDQSDSRKNGDVEVLVAGDADPKQEVEITGNQSKEYYAK